MKKLNNKRRKWFRTRAKNQMKKLGRVVFPSRNRFKRFLVDIWQGSKIEKAICTKPPINPPDVLCFDENTIETVNFFDERRSILLGKQNFKKSRFVIRSSKSKMPRIPGFIDFSKIKKINTSSCVVLAAEYQRLHDLISDVPPTINLEQWDSDVFRTLFQLGFFEIVGLSKSVEEFLVGDSDTLTMRLLSGRDTTELERADKALMDLGDFIYPGSSLPEDVAIPFITGLSEAMTNVTRHAYPKDYEFQYPPVNRWWVTGTADRIKRTLTVVIYDQGATIPVTYSRKSLSTAVRDFLRKHISPSSEFEYQNDGHYIEAALRYGASQTDEPFRGRGLPQMIDTINAAGKGRLVIWSRGGRTVVRPGQKFTSTALPVSVGGTLIEWNVELPDAI